MEIWFTSDTHFDHENILKYENRPFADANEMTEALIDNWNNVVKPDDLIFHLGDVFFTSAARMEYIAKRLNGRKILIRGNHDKGISNGKFRKLGFDVYNYYFFEDFILSHYPQNENALRTAIANTDLKGNICGHLHSKGKDLPKDIYKCVSVELTNYKPINFSDIRKEIFVRKMVKRFDT